MNITERFRQQRLDIAANAGLVIPPSVEYSNWFGKKACYGNKKCQEARSKAEADANKLSPEDYKLMHPWVVGNDDIGDLMKNEPVFKAIFERMKDQLQTMKFNGLDYARMFDGDTNNGDPLIVGNGYRERDYLGDVVVPQALDVFGQYQINTAGQSPIPDSLFLNRDIDTNRVVLGQYVRDNYVNAKIREANPTKVGFTGSMQNNKWLSDNKNQINTWKTEPLKVTSWDPSVGGKYNQHVSNADYNNFKASDDQAQIAVRRYETTIPTADNTQLVDSLVDSSRGGSDPNAKAVIPLALKVGLTLAIVGSAIGFGYLILKS